MKRKAALAAGIVAAIALIGTVILLPSGDSFVPVPPGGRVAGGGPIVRPKGIGRAVVIEAPGMSVNQCEAFYVAELSRLGYTGFASNLVAYFPPEAHFDAYRRGVRVAVDITRDDPAKPTRAVVEQTLGLP